MQTKHWLIWQLKFSLHIFFNVNWITHTIWHSEQSSTATALGFNLLSWLHLNYLSIVNKSTLTMYIKARMFVYNGSRSHYIIQLTYVIVFFILNRWWLSPKACKWGFGNFHHVQYMPSQLNDLRENTLCCVWLNIVNMICWHQHIVFTEYTAHAMNVIQYTHL